MSLEIISILNTTLASNSTQPLLLTEFELWVRVSFGLILGLPSIVMHTLISVSIYRIEKLSNRFHVFMFFLSIARVMYAFGHANVALYRTFRTLNLISLAATALVCHSIQIFKLFPPTLELLLLFLLVLDRQLAFAFPIFYRQLGKRQAILICILAYAFWLLFRVLPSYFNVSSTRVIQCINTFSPLDPVYALYGQYLDLTLTLSILVVYVFLLLSVSYRLKKDDNRDEGAGKNSVKRLMKVLPFLRLQLLMHCTLVLTSRAMEVAAGYVDDVTSQRMIAYYGIIACIDVFVNGIIFYYKYPNIFFDNLKLLCGKKLAIKIAGDRILSLAQSTAPGGGATTVAPQSTINAGVRQLIIAELNK